MGTRLLMFTGNDPETPNIATLADGREVQKGETVEVDIHEARGLLRASGKVDDSVVDWLPEPRQGD